MCTQILFKITWLPNDGTLILYPDFNNYEVNPYYIEIDSDSRNMFHYGIKNISSIDQIHINFNNLNFNDVMDQKTDTFELPKSKFARNILIPFNIISLEKFRKTNCYVRYSFHVPTECDIINGHNHGCTHLSIPNNGIWQLGHCFNLMISDELGQLENLKISFEVISIDRRNIERIEGRCFFNIAINSGVYEHQLDCLREINNSSFYDKLQRFFIGGLFQFNVEAFNSIENNNNNSIRISNRYGNNTISAGKININYNILIQKHPMSNKILMKSLKQYGKLNSIEKVLHAYHMAKRKLDKNNSE